MAIVQPLTMAAIVTVTPRWQVNSQHCDVTTVVWHAAVTAVGYGVLHHTVH